MAYKYIGTFKDLLDAGFRHANEGRTYFIKTIKQGEIEIDIITGKIWKRMYDHTTYTGYKYANEYNQTIKPYLKELFSKGLIKEVKENE